MSEDTASGQVPFQDSRSNSSQAYLKRAASAVAEGDSVLGIHLYLAAYERALRESIMPGEEVLKGMSKAWDLAIETKQRSLAEYIFEKLEPYWDGNEVSRHADELQRLAFDKLEEYGFDRDAIDVSLLSDRELAQLNTYHARVLSALAPHLDAETLDWLRAAAAPLEK